MRSILSGMALLGISSIGAFAYDQTNCKDPWIAQAMYQVYHRMPYANSPTTEECNIANYNGGHWNTYGELVSYVRARASQTPPPDPGFASNIRNSTPVSATPVVNIAPSAFNSLPQRNYLGAREVQFAGIWYVIASGGGNLVSNAGGTLLSTNGGNIISSDAASVIASGGGNVVGPGSGSSVIASGGGNVIAAGAGNVIAQGAGNITLYKARQ